ncbi:hypothetical protein Ahy_A03g011705 [Arachis hypogaea]|uniref:Uncharacterized protein n=1 Tax=Arachis hypogaea TaxID=3818 RepID=A0A445DRI3_ARAHY|nr:hypothetical protein Ahy_A03g011705 [Arachis hypogaea]
MELFVTGHISPWRRKRRCFVSSPNLSNSSSPISRLHRNGEVGVVGSGGKKEVLPSMASEGVSSSWRRSGGQVGSSSHPKEKDGKHGVSPKCFCGENAILFMSKTRSNLDRLFLGYPFYKHVARLGLTETKYIGEKEFFDVEDYHR